MAKAKAKVDSKVSVRGGGSISERLRRTRKRHPEVIEIIKDDEDQLKDHTPDKKKQKLSQLTSLVKSFTTTPSNTEETDLRAKIRTNSIPEELQSDITTTKGSTDDQWIEKYKPTSSSNTAIHTRKLKDIRESLSSILLPNSTTKLLVLSGPSGASKSTIIRHLANELIPTNLPFIEWVNPIETYSAQFEDFLSTAKYRTGKNKSLILVEDLPNVLHQETRESFQRAVLEWINVEYELPPLVICITECEFVQDDDRTQSYNIENSYTAETILGRRILSSPSVTRIKFNPINATLIKKYLNIICASESLFKEIPKSEIDQKIIELSLFGDIRAAISALQFWAQLRSHDEFDLKLGKESTISIFHAIGKIVFGTKEDEPESTSMDKVMKDFSNRSELLMLGLLENYQKFNKMEYPVSVASSIADCLSHSNCLKPDSIALECAIRSTRQQLSHVTFNHGRNDGFNFPREIKSKKIMLIAKKEIERYIEIEMRTHRNIRSFQDSNLFHGFFEPIINKNRLFRNRSKIHYLQATKQKVPAHLYEPPQPYITERLGGEFREVGADQDSITEDTAVSYTGSNTCFFSFNVSENESDDEFEDDPIVDTDEDKNAEGNETFGDDDTFENELVAASQIKRQDSSLSKNHEFFDDFDEGFSD